MEEKVLNAIINYIKEHKYAPTVRELCTLTGLKSTSSVQYYIKRLLDKGLLETDGEFDASRALRVSGYDFVKVSD